LLTTQFIAFGDQSISLITQSHNSVNVDFNTAFFAVVDNKITMIADKLQIQHG
jgi:hypothetical protein